MRWLIICLLPVLLLTGCEKFALDRKMEKLCKKDGGVKVFETTTLPASEFDALYSLFLKHDRSKGANNEDRLGSVYRYAEFWETIKAGDPMKGEGRLTKYIEKIYRKSDEKLLGISIQYGRAGGDLVVLGHWSTAACPVSMQSLFKSTFIKGK